MSFVRSTEFVEEEIKIPKKIFLTKRGALYLFLSIFGAVLGIIIEFHLLVFLSYFGLILILIDYISISNFRLEELQVDRYIDKKALFAGQYTYIEVNVKNNSKVRLDQLIIQDTYPIEFEKTLGRTNVVCALNPQDTARFGYIVKAISRGVYRLGPFRVVIRSPFSLFFREDFIKKYDDLTIYPILERSEKMYYMAKTRKITKFFGAHRSRTKGVGTDFYGIREYTRFDDYRTIDWKASARTLKLMVREFIVEVPLTIYIMVDSSYSMGFGEPIQKLDYAIDATMFLAKFAVDNHDKVGLLVFSDAVHSYIPARADPRNLLLFQRELAKVIPEGGKDYVMAMKYLLENWRGTGLIILISDLEGNIESLMEAIRIARLRKNKVFILHYYTPYFEEKEEERSLLDKSVEAYVFDKYQKSRRDLSKELLKIGSYLITVSPKVFLPILLEEFTKKIGVGVR